MTLDRVGANLFARGRYIRKLSIARHNAFPNEFGPTVAGQKERMTLDGVGANLFARGIHPHPVYSLKYSQAFHPVGAHLVTSVSSYRIELNSKTISP